MYKPNESRPGSPKRLGLRLAAMTGVAALVAATGMLLQLPRGATAGVATGADDRVAPPASNPAPNKKAQGTYRLRCWQYGRLLFDEGPVTLSPETRQGARVVAFDRHGGTLIVSDAGWTTCQARPFPPAPNLALPR